MKRGTRIFLSLYLGFVVYCVAMLIFGRTGVLASRELQEYRGRLEQNLSGLHDVNERLAAEFESLRSDPDTIRVEANKLGFYAQDQRVMRLGNSPQDASVYSIGSLVIEAKRSSASDGAIRSIGLGATLIFYLFSGVFRRKPHGYKER